MDSTIRTVPNVHQAVPFFAVSDMEASLRYYVDGLGFDMMRKWIDEGKLRWCWLQRGGAALMLQEYRTEGHGAWVPDSKVGEKILKGWILIEAEITMNYPLETLIRVTGGGNAGRRFSVISRELSQLVQTDAWR